MDADVQTWLSRRNLEWFWHWNWTPPTIRPSNCTPRCLWSICYSWYVVTMVTIDVLLEQLMAKTCLSADLLLGPVFAFNSEDGASFAHLFLIFFKIFFSSFANLFLFLLLFVCFALKINGNHSFLHHIYMTASLCYIWKLCVSVLMMLIG